MQRHLRVALGRPDARHADRRGAHDPVLVEPRRRCCCPRPSRHPVVITVPVALCAGAGRQPRQRHCSRSSSNAQDRPAAGAAWPCGNLLFKVAGCIVFLRRACSSRSAHLAASIRITRARCCISTSPSTLTIADRSSSASPAGRRASSTTPACPAPAPTVRPGQSRATSTPRASHTPALALANAARETLRIGDTVEQMLERHARGDPHQRHGNASTEIDQARRRRGPPLHRDQALPHADQRARPSTRRTSRRWAGDHARSPSTSSTWATSSSSILQDLRDKKIAHRLHVLRGRHDGDRGDARQARDQPAPRPVGVPERRPEERADAARAEGRASATSSAATHDSHLDRLSGQTVQSIETSSLHLDIISDMRRINSFFCSTAYPILEQAGPAAQEPPAWTPPASSRRVPSCRGHDRTSTFQRSSHGPRDRRHRAALPRPRRTSSTAARA